MTTATRTTATRKSPNTPAAFRRHAERVFRNSNPDAVAIGFVITWERCNRCEWADGSHGFSGTIRVSAPGFRTQTMIATSTPDGISVR